MADVADAKQKVSDVISAVTEPGKMERLKDLAIERLPYHPQYLHKGTVYSAELQSPLTFGTVTPVTPAPPGVKPAPSTILKARLVTALDSSTTPRGTPLEAVVTEPVFSADRQLILPEGTRLTGEITAGHFYQRPGRWCSYCDFLPVCLGDQQKVHETLVQVAPRS